MRKLKLYLDTSVPSAYFDTKNGLRCKVTKYWWDKVMFSEYEVFVSNVTIAELTETKNDDLRESFLELVKDIHILEIIDGTKELAEDYIKNGIIPEEYLDDAIHIALATLHGADLIVSWNFKHMVNPLTRRQIKAINLLNGLREIDIVSPEELGGYKDE
jgi:predicted nucleic acid-binding protein